jgi:hypothetical protein
MSAHLIGPRCKRCHQGPARADGFCPRCWHGLGAAGRAAFDAHFEDEIANIDWDAALRRLEERGAA